MQEVATANEELAKVREERDMAARKAEAAALQMQELIEQVPPMFVCVRACVSVSVSVSVAVGVVRLRVSILLPLECPNRAEEQSESYTQGRWRREPPDCCT